jgi:hypothetical protein
MFDGVANKGKGGPDYGRSKAIMLVMPSSLVGAHTGIPVGASLARMVALPVLPILACAAAALVLSMIVRSIHSDGHGTER